MPKAKSGPGKQKTPKGAGRKARRNRYNAKIGYTSGSALRRIAKTWQSCKHRSKRVPKGPCLVHP